MRFKDLKIGTRVALGFLLVAIISGICGYIFLQYTLQARKLEAELYAVNAKQYGDIGGVAVAFQRTCVNLRDMVIEKDSTSKNNYAKTIIDLDKTINNGLTSLEKSIKSEEDRKIFNQLKSSIDKFVPVRESIISLALANQDNQAVVLMHEKGDQLAKDVEEQINNVFDTKINQAIMKSNINSVTANSAERTMLIMMCLGNALYLVIAIAIARGITRPVKKLAEAMNKLATGNVDVNIETETETKDEIGLMAQSLSSMAENIKTHALAAEKVAAGDLSMEIKIQSDKDLLGKNLDSMLKIIKKLIKQVEDLIKATQEGKLDTRGNAAAFTGGWGQLVSGINNLIDAFVDPINVTAEYIDRISKGDIPPKITDTYMGDFNQIKNNLNNCIDNIGALVADANMLEAAAMEGNLGTRADVNKHSGDYRKIVQVVNNTLDALLSPLHDGVNCLKEMAEGNLDIRVTGKYQGDHAIIKDALNATLEVLNEIIKKETVRCLQEISKGNLDVAVTGSYKGDYSIIKETLNITINDLNDVLGQVSTAIEQVSAGAHQVSDSSQALSQGAAESASTIAQITSSMDGMNAQTKQNAENATQANQLAIQARANAERGNEQMGQMVKAMEEINESAANISKIIKAIDEIAFQTNLLALNAAVEAARAGKHGKGFTVVAEEVRNLAQRSAKAAKETAEMIEGSIKKTEVGTRIAEETSKALEEIVLGVSKVTDFISEIASASKEQALGIGQINEGLVQVDQVTQQNSASSEELAAASEEMSSQAEMVRQMLGKFKLKRQAGGNAFTTVPVSADKPYLAHNKMGRGAAQKYRLEATATSSSSSRLNPEDVISLDDLDYGKF
jgi:methyl-accepting chemotaxis protein